jgi:hypothetical protein
MARLKYRATRAKRSGADDVPVELMMAAGAGMILWVAFQYLKEFWKSRRVRALVVALVTIPAAIFLWAIAFRVL